MRGYRGSVDVCDETDFGFGWIAPEPALMQRCSHALVDEGAVWVIDPVDVPGLDERIRALGRPAGVLQLLDRHGRNCAAVAARLEVPLHVVPFARVAGAPFEPVPIVRNRFWREVALWWPERRVLVCADAVGSGPFFRGPDERLGVHPFLRLVPPRRLRGLDPLHVLCGHGPDVHGEEATPALREALATARRRLPAHLLRVARLSFRR